jgi:hypothetical protein
VEPRLLAHVVALVRVALVYAVMWSTDRLSWGFRIAVRVLLVTAFPDVGLRGVVAEVAQQEEVQQEEAQQEEVLQQQGQQEEVLQEEDQQGEVLQEEVLQGQDNRGLPREEVAPTETVTRVMGLEEIAVPHRKTAPVGNLVILVLAVLISRSVFLGMVAMFMVCWLVTPVLRFVLMFPVETQIALRLPLPRETANHRHPIALRVQQSVVVTTHGLVRMRKQGSRNATRNPVRNPVQLNQRVPVAVEDPIKATTLLQAPVRNHVDKVQPPSVVLLSKNVTHTPGWDWVVIFTSATILPAEDHKDRSRVGTARVAVADLDRVEIVPAAVADLSRVVTAQEGVEALTRVILPAVAGDRVIVRHQAKVLLPVNRVRVRVRKAPHVPAPVQSRIVPAKAQPIVVKMAAGPAGMMRTTARLLREQVMKLPLALHSSPVSGMHL